MAGPAPRDIDIYRGDDYAHVLEFVNNAIPPVALDLSDYTFRAEIRDRPEKGRDILATFTIDESEKASGKIVLHLTAGLTRIPSGYWDLEVNNGSITKTWLKGSVTVSGDVTQGVTL